MGGKTKEAINEGLNNIAEMLLDGLEKNQKILDNYEFDLSGLTIKVNEKVLSKDLVDQLYNAVKIANKQLQRKNIPFGQFKLKNIAVSSESFFYQDLITELENLNADQVDDAVWAIENFIEDVGLLEKTIDNFDSSKFREQIGSLIQGFDIDDEKLGISELAERIENANASVYTAMERLKLRVENYNFEEWFDFEKIVDNISDGTASITDLLKFDISKFNPDQLKAFSENINKILNTFNSKSGTYKILSNYKEIFDSGILSQSKGTSDLSEINNILAVISATIKDIKDSFGEIDSDTGLNKLTQTLVDANTQLGEMVTKLTTISSRLRDANFSKTIIDDSSMLLSQQRDHLVKEAEKAAADRALKAYDKVMSLFESSNIADPFTSIKGKLSGDYTTEGLENLFSREAIENIDDAATKLERIQKFLNLIKEVASKNADVSLLDGINKNLPLADELNKLQEILEKLQNNKYISKNNTSFLKENYPGVFDDNISFDNIDDLIDRLNKVISLRTPFWNQVNNLLSDGKEISKSTFNDSYLKGKRNKILDIKNGKTNNLNKYEDIVNSLKEIQDILNRIADENPLVEALNQAIVKLDEFSDKIIELIPNINIVSQSFINTDIGNATTAPLQQVENALEEVEEQAKETSDAISGVLVYRGTNGDNPISNNPAMGGTFWTTSKSSAAKHGANNDSKTLFSSELSLVNPLIVDAMEAQVGQILYLGDASDETSKKITDLVNKQQELKKKLADTTISSDEATKSALELQEVYKEINKISMDDSNPYGYHHADWFGNYASENGYDSAVIKNVLYGDINNPEKMDLYITTQKEQLNNTKLLAKANQELAESEQMVWDSEKGLISISNEANNSSNQPVIESNEEVAQSANEAREAEEKLHEEERASTDSSLDEENKVIEEFIDSTNSANKAVEELKDVLDSDNTDSFFEKETKDIKDLIDNTEYWLKQIGDANWGESFSGDAKNGYSSIKKKYFNYDAETDSYSISENVITNYKQLENLIIANGKAADNLQGKIVKLNSQGVNTKQYEDVLQYLRLIGKELNKEYESYVEISNVEKLANDKQKNEFNYKKENQLLNNRRSIIQGIIKDITTQLNIMEKLDNTNSSFNKNLLTQRNELNSALSNINLDKDFDSALNKLEVILTNVNKLRQDSKNPINLNMDIDAAKKDIITINNLLYEQSSMSRTNKKRLKEIRETYNTMLTSGNGNQKVLNDLHNRLLDIQMDITEAGKKGQNMFDKLVKASSSRTANMFAQFFSFYDIIRYSREAVSTIVDLDTALVDLRKTTKMTSTELGEFYYSSSDLAKQMGVTTENVISQAAAWSRLGYSTKEEIETLTELSSKFAAISPEVDTDAAQEGLVSAMKGFQLTTEEAEREIADNINRIGNTMATSNADIITMLEKSSAAMDAANNTIRETIALESAAFEITQNAETTGTAFKTISMRIRGYDEETEELSDDLKNITGDIANLTKTAKHSSGVSLFKEDDPNTYKSTYQILKEISEIWGELTDKQQAGLLEKLGGKRGAQTIAGLLNDFSQVEFAMDQMEEAEGAADAEMTIIKDSIEYKINALKETWVSYLKELIDRKDIKEVVDSLISMSESFGDAISSTAPLLKVVITLLEPIITLVSGLSNALGGTLPYLILSSTILVKLNKLGLSGSQIFDSMSDSFLSALDSLKEFYDTYIKTLNVSTNVSDSSSNSINDLTSAATTTPVVNDQKAWNDRLNFRKQFAKQYSDQLASEAKNEKKALIKAENELSKESESIRLKNAAKELANQKKRSSELVAARIEAEKSKDEAVEYLKSTEIPPVATGWDRFFSKIKSGFDNVVTSVSTFALSVKNKIDEAGKYVYNTVNSIAETLSNTINSIPYRISQAREGIFRGLNTIGNSISKSISSATSGIWNGLISGSQYASKIISETFNSSLDFARSVPKKISEFRESFFSGMNSIEKNTADFSKNVSQDISDGFSDGVDNARASISSFENKFEQFRESIFSSIDKIRNGISGIKDSILQNIDESFGDKFTEVIEDEEIFVPLNLDDDSIDLFKEKLESIEEVSENLDLFEGLEGEASDAVENILDNISDQLDNFDGQLSVDDILPSDELSEEELQLQLLTMGEEELAQARTADTIAANENTGSIEANTQAMINASTAAMNLSLADQELVNAEVSDVIQKAQQTAGTTELTAAVIDLAIAEMQEKIATEGSTAARQNAIISLQNMKAQMTQTSTAVSMLKGGLIAIGIAIATWAIQKGIEQIKKAQEAANDLNAAVNKSIDTFKSSNNEVKKNVKSIKESVDSYKKLAKSVDEAGKNVALSDSDYKEYLNISNNIAEIMPELIKGWDDQGNAILTVKDNVDQLNEALDEYQKKAYYDLISGKGTQDEDGNKTTASDIIKDFKNQYNGADLIGWKNDLAGSKVVLDIMSRLEEASGSQEEFYRELNKLFEQYADVWSRSDISEAFQSSGLSDIIEDFDPTGYQMWLNGDYGYAAAGMHSYDELKNLHTNIVSEVKAIESDVNEELSKVQSIAEAYLVVDDKYNEYSEEQKNTLKQLIKTMDADVAEQIANSPNIEQAMGEYINGIYDTYSQLTTFDKVRLDDVLSGEYSFNEISKYAEDLKSQFGEDNPLYLYIKTIYEDEKEKRQRVLNKYSGSDHYAASLLMDSSNFGGTDNDYNLLLSDDFNNELNILKSQGIPTIEAFATAWEHVKNAKREATSTTGEFNISQFSKDTDEFENLQSLYEKFKENVENDKVKVPLDIGDVEGLREKWESVIGTEAFEEFEKTVTTAGVSVEDTQKAFDKAATAYANAKYQVDAITDANKDQIASQMELDGVTKDSAKTFVDFYSDLNKLNNGDVVVDVSRLEGLDLSNDISELETYASELGICTSSLAAFELQRQIDAGLTINTADDCQQLINLATKAGVSEDALDSLSKVMELLGAQEAAVQNYIDTKDRAFLMEAERLGQQIRDEKEKAKTLVEEAIASPEIKVNTTKNTTAASGAGKDAGEAYKEAYEKELEQLESDRDNHLITEKEFLAKWKDLIQKFYGDVNKYAKEYAEEMQKYNQSVLDYMNNVGSAVTSLIDRKISATQKAKDKAIKALEEEKKAATAAIDAQIKAIEEQEKAIDKEIKGIDKEIKALNKQIEAKQEVIKGIEKEISALEKQQEQYNKQIDAINDAADARERDLNLQKAQYELERQQAQRTRLVYSDERGFHYESDPTQTREAKDQVDEANRAMEIAEIQKLIDAIQQEIDKKQETIDQINEEIELIEAQIDAYEKQKEALEEQKELLEEQKEALEEQKKAIEEYYDKLIEETEKAFDEIIESLEEIKSKWEEVMMLETLSKNYGLIKDFFEGTGYTVQDIINGDMGALELYKQKYIEHLETMYSKNQGVLEGLKEFTNGSGEAYGKVAEKVGLLSSKSEEAGAGIGKLSDSIKKIDTTNTDTLASSIEDVATSAEPAAESVGTLASNTTELSSASEGVNENLAPVAESLEKISTLEGEGSATIEGIVNALTSLKNTLGSDGEEGSGLASAIDEVANALTGGEGGTGGIVGALSQLSDGATVNLEPLIGQFNQLADAAKNVVSALGGGIGADVTAGLAPTNGVETGVQGLLDTIKGLNDIDLGMESGEGIIGQFNALAEAATSVATAIGGGGGESSGGEPGAGDANNQNGRNGAKTESNNGEGGDGSIVSALDALKEKGDEVLGGGEGSEESGEDGSGGGLIGKFDKLTTSVKNTSAAIGIEGEDAKDTLIGSITSLQTVAKDKIGSPDDLTNASTVIGIFNKLEEILGLCSGHLSQMLADLNDLIATKPWEVEITVKVTDGGAYAGTAYLDKFVPANSHIVSIKHDIPHTWATSHHSKFDSSALVDGTALAGGNWGAKHGGKTLVGELGPEILVREGRWHLLGEHGAEFTDIHPGDIVFNHLQSRQLLSRGNQLKGRPKNMRGQALAGGTLPSGFSALSSDESAKYNTLLNISNNTDLMNANMYAMAKNVAGIASVMTKNVTSNVTNNSPVINVTNPQFTCTGVTGEEVLRQIEGQFTGLFTNAYQQSMKR